MLFFDLANFILQDLKRYNVVVSCHIFRFFQDNIFIVLKTYFQACLVKLIAYLKISKLEWRKSQYEMLKVTLSIFRRRHSSVKYLLYYWQYFQLQEYSATVSSNHKHSYNDSKQRNGTVKSTNHTSNSSGGNRSRTENNAEQPAYPSTFR